MKGFICDQEKKSARRGSYGPLGSVKKNGCGAIAVYNADLMLGRRADFDAVLAEVNARPFATTVALGLLGTDPRWIRRRYERAGYRVEVYRGDGEPPEGCGAYIILYMYRSGRGIAAHYAAAGYGEEGFFAANDGIAAGTGCVCEYMERAHAKKRAIFCIFRPDTAPFSHL